MSPIAETLTRLKSTRSVSIASCRVLACKSLSGPFQHLAKIPTFTNCVWYTCKRVTKLRGYDMLQFKYERQDETLIVDFIVPSLCEGPQMDHTAERLQAMIGPGRSRHVVVNLSRINFAASRALSLFITMKQALELYDGKLVLCGMKQQIAQIFRLAGLDRYLNIADTQDQALELLASLCERSPASDTACA
mgnify:CR=1 FL=1